MGVCSAEEDKGGHMTILQNFFNMPKDKMEAFLNKMSKSEKAKGKTIINAPINSHGDTLLHYAVFHGKKELITFLLANGADKTIKNKYQLSPMDIATKRNPAMEKILQKAK